MSKRFELDCRFVLPREALTPAPFDRYALVIENRPARSALCAGREFVVLRRVGLPAARATKRASARGSNFCIFAALIRKASDCFFFARKREPGVCRRTRLRLL